MCQVNKLERRINRQETGNFLNCEDDVLDFYFVDSYIFDTGK